jgi:hypothetical protein
VDPSKTALPVGTYNVSPVTGFATARIQILNNPTLRWEKSAMMNLAIDFAMKRNLISGSIEYYEKTGTDLYGPSPYDYTVWGATSSIIINSASMKGKGIDIILNSKNIDGKFKWYSGFLFNYNTNKVTKYYSASANQITSKINSAQSIAPVIGKPVYAIAAYKWGGLDSIGNPRGYVNGKLSTDYIAIVTEGTLKGVDGNLVYMGPSSPPFFGSVTNSFLWKNFSLSVLLNYKIGYYFRKSSLSYPQLVNGLGHKDYAKRWQKPGDELSTNVPSFIYPINSSSRRRDDFYNASEILVLKADHIRLQYINLSYSLEKAKFKKLPFKDLQVYANAANLGILWRANKENLDPEYPSSIPTEKTWTFGIRANLK